MNPQIYFEEIQIILMKNKMLNKIMVELILLAIVLYSELLVVADMFGRVVSTTKHATKFKFKDL